MNDLSLHIMDIMQNSVAAGATAIGLHVEENTVGDELSITITDNGRGMTQDQVGRLSDPFFTSRTTRKVGMGIPLFRQSAEQAGGGIEILSVPGEGTTVRAWFGRSHIDRPPMGDLPNSFMLTVSSRPEIEYTFSYAVDGRSYSFDTREVKEVLGDIPLNEPSVIRMLTEMIRENIRDVEQGLRG